MPAKNKTNKTNANAFAREETQAPVRIVMISLDHHLSGVAAAAEAQLRKKIPNLQIAFHAAADWNRDQTALADCHSDIANANIIIASMIFTDEHISAVKDAIAARRQSCDAVIGCMSGAEIVQMTKLGKFDMAKPQKGPIALLKKLRGKGGSEKAGAQQMKTLRRLPKILKFIPGTAQDVRAYFLSMQYLLAGAEENIENLIAFLVDRYANNERSPYRGTLSPALPAEYPEIGLYHPRMNPPIADRTNRLPLARTKRPTVGLLVLRSYILSGDTGHYDGVIAALEAQGLKVVPAFASGLDARPAIEEFFVKDGAPAVDAVLSLTGFSLVGGPAYNDADAAAQTLTGLDVPYIAAHALELQSLNEWGKSDRGLTPLEATLLVAIPELDGATGSTFFGGRPAGGADYCEGCDRRCNVDKRDGQGPAMITCPERAEMVARRVQKIIRLRHKTPTERRIAITLFNFPPNGGAVGSAAFLSVFESLFNFLRGLKAAGYNVDLPEDAEALRVAIVEGNSERYGAPANVHDFIAAGDHISAETRLAEIEKQWGPAPGRQQTDGRSIQILGAAFGSVFVGVQPAFGYEGDPMKLLFEKSFTPTHAFAAYYRYLRESFSADAIVHFGTHGALEFMPGKQTGLGGECWPDYLIDDLPNIYFYAANNPSEASIAKRRSAATTVSYLTPPLTNADLYKGLSDLKEMIGQWRSNTLEDDALAGLTEMLQAQAASLDLCDASPAWTDPDAELAHLSDRLYELETSLIPEGLHVAGNTLTPDARADYLTATGEIDGISADAVKALVQGDALSEIAATFKLSQDQHKALERLAEMNAAFDHDTEIPALLHALNGGFTPPAPGGDIIRTPAVLPTGRNIHGFDPYRLPSRFAVTDGAHQAEKIIDRFKVANGRAPSTAAIVLWGADNLKSEGAQISQAMSLIGARPRFDGFGRLCGAELIPIDELGRARVDVVVTVSGIFRDLLPLQMKMLAEAAALAAEADEPLHLNPIKRNTEAIADEHQLTLEEASLRVFSNADGAYGANVNLLIDSGCWDTEDELADTFVKRKGFAYATNGEPSNQGVLLEALMAKVDFAFQNLESVELGVTTIDHYFDTLGGIGRAVEKAKGEKAPIFIGDQTRGDGVVRTLAEQVELETRTRTLNPKWYEGMLNHGYEGVRQIEAYVTNTVGWSATTGAVAPWVYQQITETFVLDEALRDRLATLNPHACAKVANRLLEASDRNYWSPDADTLEALRQAGEELEDRIEGVAALPVGASA
ncbi:MAG: magnesium chelatase subunit H [Pseudomonadota bacterium]